MQDSLLESIVDLLVQIRDGNNKLITLLEANQAMSSRPAPAADPNFKEGVFTGWKAARIPRWPKFDANVQLGDLGEKALDYWLNRWTPREPIKPEDAALLRALEFAKAEIAAGTYTPPQYTNKPKEPKREGAPASKTPPAASTKPPEDITGEDVPF